MIATLFMLKHPVLTCDRSKLSALYMFQTYYQTVIGETESGNVTAMSDGIGVVIDNYIITDVDIQDGPYCFQNTSDGLC